MLSGFQGADRKAAALCIIIAHSHDITAGTAEHFIKIAIRQLDVRARRQQRRRFVLLADSDQFQRGIL